MFLSEEIFSLYYFSFKLKQACLGRVVGIILRLLRPIHTPSITQVQYQAQVQAKTFFLKRPLCPADSNSFFIMSLTTYYFHQSTWNDEYSRKYGSVGTGLPAWQVARFGRQMLEGLLFLKEKGFPPFRHLHSGNVVVQNGVAR